ncbi:efflux transporter periplasmic adaptor subunit, partial [Paraburkholderia sp. SIMBA_054]
ERVVVDGAIRVSSDAQIKVVSAAPGSTPGAPGTPASAPPAASAAASAPAAALAQTRPASVSP